MMKLYHGTMLKNIKSICKEGLKKATEGTCTKYSKERKFISDCIGNVSLTKNQKDAIFFASAVSDYEGEVSGTQAIIEIDDSKLRKSLMFTRDMFDKEKAEVKYFDDIPPNAITSILLREFKDEKGKFKVTERTISCKDVNNKQGIHGCNSERLKKV